MGLFDKKDQDIEKKLIIKTTSRWESFVKGLKYFVVFIISCLIIYGLFLTFGGFIFGSIILTYIISSMFLMKIVEVPTEYFIEARIDVTKEVVSDDKENVKSTTFVLNEYAIPVEMLKSFEIEGDTSNKWTSRSGKTRSIVQKVDLDKKKITYCWFSKIDDFKFMVDRNTFFICRDLFQEQNKNLLINEHTRELYYKLELSKMYRSLNVDKTKDKIFDTWEKGVEAKIKKIWDYNTSIKK